MQKFQPKTKEQMARIFGLAKKHDLDFDDEARSFYAAEVSKSRVTHLSQLSFDEANALIKQLGGDPFRSATPRRTQNYHRQQAGVPQIAQRDHLKLMRDLADSRNMSESGLESLGQRILHHWPPRTTKETNKIVEALKAMNARDRVKEAA